jgi:hypothetical protein
MKLTDMTCRPRPIPHSSCRSRSQGHEVMPISEACKSGRFGPVRFSHGRTAPPRVGFRQAGSCRTRPGPALIAPEL